MHKIELIMTLALGGFSWHQNIEGVYMKCSSLCRVCG